MQIFEFHFNPRNKEDVVFDSFCFEPENIYEKRVGSLYMIGLLKNVLPQNIRFLEKLAKTIRERYYKTISGSQEKSLKESLKKANDYLEKIAKTGDVSWMGNLSFAVVTLKNHEINFTKSGDIKILLIRKGQVVDIDQKLKFEDMEPYPLKIFGNIVSGKLAENDIILLLTQEIYNILFQEKLLAEIARISLYPKLSEESRRIKELFNSRKEKLLRETGACILAVLSKENLPKERESLNEKKKLKIFSLKKVFQPIIEKLSFLKLSFKKPVFKVPNTKIRIPQVRITRPKISKPVINVDALKFVYKNKNIILILSLIFFLLVGFFIFKKQEEGKLRDYQTTIDQIKEKQNLAETYLLMAEKTPVARSNANSILMENWKNLSPLLNEASTFPASFANTVFELKDKIMEGLYEMNKLVEIKEPETVYEFSLNGYIPHRIVSAKDDIYLYSPYSKNIFDLQNKNTISTEKEVDLAVSSSEKVFFFSKPNSVLTLQEEIKESSLKSPYSGFDFSAISDYGFNLYFLDKNEGKIVKYPYSGNDTWENPQMWADTKTANEFESMAVDGFVWLLTKENTIKKYYSGKLQTSIYPEIFPDQKDFSKIYTLPDLPYLYIMEPIQKRIVVLDKLGEVVRQFQSEKFDHLLDFTVSETGTIYILNGLKVYKIKP